MWGWQGSKSNLLRFGVSVVMAETSSALVLWHWEMSLACAHGCTSHSHQQSTLCCTGQLPECSHLLKDTHCCVPGVFYPAACITIHNCITLQHRKRLPTFSVSQYTCFVLLKILSYFMSIHSIFPTVSTVWVTQLCRGSTFHGSRSWNHPCLSIARQNPQLPKLQDACSSCRCHSLPWGGRRHSTHIFANQIFL